MVAMCGEPRSRDHIGKERLPCIFLGFPKPLERRLLLLAKLDFLTEQVRVRRVLL
jgi:hypothetical protein